MRIWRTFQTIDTHTGGEPTRTVVGGVPVIPGATMQEKFIYMQTHNDWMRKVLSLEPRGNEVMSGAFLTPPCTPGTDIGVIYYETGGWLPMCGHDTIGVATALVETGMVEVKEPFTDIVLDTPGGIVKVRVKVENQRAKSVTFLNAPAFVIGRDYCVDTPEFGRVVFDVAYGGNMYAILSAAALGLELVPERSKEIVAKGVLLRKYINEQIQVRHPLLPFVDKVTHIEFSAPSATPGVSARNAVIITSAAIDRSPCGTGTSAKMALLHAKGELKVNETFVHESLIGSIFTCRIIEETEIAGMPAIVPEISGRAFITGMSTFMMDPEDPLAEGFELS
ncbi:proline racemase family protein [Candidatus Formimonas warabiya]|uniref:Proline racemase n=1 Tax=Formimonas warabiya TaxID=1761012 RepID=A0A3G1KYY2_FORW1|nr:proline racemase family protein [Candidatus Formimonas warabiya]ATW27698.1 proline racemase [Candidatus Formimonas warabiya]